MRDFLSFNGKFTDADETPNAAEFRKQTSRVDIRPPKTCQDPEAKIAPSLNQVVSSIRRAGGESRQT